MSIICLGKLGVKEIAEQNLFPIGQFYLRTFDPLTKKDAEEFQSTLTELLAELKNAVDNGSVPYYIGVQMNGTIRKTMENVISKGDKEVDAIMTTNIIETLPWIATGPLIRGCPLSKYNI